MSRGSLFPFPKSKARTKTCSSHCCNVKILGNVASDLRMRKELSRENPLQNLNRVTNFSQKKFKKKMNMLAIQTNIAEYDCL